MPSRMYLRMTSASVQSVPSPDRISSSGGRAGRSGLHGFAMVLLASSAMYGQVLSCGPHTANPVLNTAFNFPYAGPIANFSYNSRRTGQIGTQ
jgi:hypothetical protein